MRITFDHESQEFSDLGSRIDQSSHARPRTRGDWSVMASGYLKYCIESISGSRALVQGQGLGVWHGQVIPGWHGPGYHLYTTPGTPGPACPTLGTPDHLTAGRMVLWALKRECVTLKWLHKSI